MFLLLIVSPLTSCLKQSQKYDSQWRLQSIGEPLFVDSYNSNNNNNNNNNNYNNNKPLFVETQQFLALLDSNTGQIRKRLRISSDHTMVRCINQLQNTNNHNNHNQGCKSIGILTLTQLLVVNKANLDVRSYNVPLGVRQELLGRINNPTSTLYFSLSPITQHPIYLSSTKTIYQYRPQKQEWILYYKLSNTMELIALIGKGYVVGRVDDKYTLIQLIDNQINQLAEIKSITQLRPIKEQRSQLVLGNEQIIMVRDLIGGFNGQNVGLGHNSYIHWLLLQSRSSTGYQVSFRTINKVDQKEIVVDDCVIVLKGIVGVEGVGKRGQNSNNLKVVINDRQVYKIVKDSNGNNMLNIATLIGNGQQTTLNTNPSSGRKQSQSHTTLALPQSATSIHRLFITSQIPYLILTNDLTLTAYSPLKQLLWNRNQAISRVVSALMVGSHDSGNDQGDIGLGDYDNYVRTVVRDRNDYDTINHNSNNPTTPSILNLLFLRLKSDLSSLQSLTNLNLPNSPKFSMSSNQQNNYGFRKLIYLFSNIGCYMGYDTKNLDLKWKVCRWGEKSMGMWEIDGRVVVVQELVGAESGKGDQKGHANKQNVITIKVSLLNNQGHFIEQKTYQHSILISNTSNNIIKKAFLLNEKSIGIRIEGQIYIYTVATVTPTTAKTDNLGGIIIIDSNTHTNTVRGLKIQHQSNKLEDQWQIRLPINDKIAQIASSSSVSTDGAISYQPAITAIANPQGDLIFKSLDDSNIAIVTSNSQNNTITLYLIAGRTGQIFYHAQQSGVVDTHQTISLLYSQHSIFVTYFNLRNKIWELWSLECYKWHIERSAWEIIKDYWHGKQYEPQSSRHSLSIVQHVYGLPVTAQKIYVTSSPQSLTSRTLLVLTFDNKVYSLPRALVSARRQQLDGHDGIQPPTTQAPTSDSQTFLPPYYYLLPFNPTWHLIAQSSSYLTNLIIGHTNLQSTIYLFAYGHDLSLLRYAPERSFDSITHTFNWIVLLGVVVAMTLLVFFLREKARVAKIRKIYMR